jgi:hypothetical protein
VPALINKSAGVRDFAELWRGADKLVDSRTLQTMTSARAQIEREFWRRGGLLKRLARGHRD